MAGMIFQTEPTEILGYGAWDEDNERMGEWVRVKFDGDQQTRRYTVDRGINGSRPKPGTVVSLYCASLQRVKGYLDRNNEVRERTVEKIRVVGFGDPQPAAA